MKIKTKKQLNLPQLIEWGFNNPEIAKGKFYLTKEHEVYSPYVQFSIDGYGVRTSQSLTNKDTFTVEVEETVTEDTKLDLVERFIGGMGYACYTSHGDMTIRECLKHTPREFTTTHFYIENDDRDLLLIWRDGKLVE